MIFEDCRLARGAAARARLNEGFVDSLKVLDGGRISIAALSIGMAQGAYDAALKYSKLRKQFGRPISEFQAIQHKLVDMAVDLDAARLLNYRAGVDARPRQARHARIGDGEAVRVRGGGAHRQRGGADPRRLRLHQRLPGGEVLSRREALHHRRRHQRDPAPGDRAAAPEKLMNDWARKSSTVTCARWPAPPPASRIAIPKALAALRELAPYAGTRASSASPDRPGAGKSTLVDAIWRARCARRRRPSRSSRSIPSSRNTGGAILGDRIRMQQHHADPGIFIRSMATRGTTGGLARATADMAR